MHNNVLLKKYWINVLGQAKSHVQSVDGDSRNHPASHIHRVRETSEQNTNCKLKSELPFKMEENRWVRE